MNWPGGDKGRILAGLYLFAFVAMVVGLVWTLYNQTTGGDGAQMAAGGATFVIAQLIIAAMAVGLRAALPDAKGAEGSFQYQRAWQRLTLGRELGTAMHRLKGDAQSDRQ